MSVGGMVAKLRAGFRVGATRRAAPTARALGAVGDDPLHSDREGRVVTTHSDRSHAGAVLHVGEYLHTSGRAV